MYEIPIDDQNYHVNRFTEAERKWCTQTRERVLKRYKDLSAFVTKTAAPLQMDKMGVMALLDEVVLAFSHTMKTVCIPQTQEQADKKIKSWLYSFFPFVVGNLKVVRSSHPVQFEPIPLTVLHVSHAFMSGIPDDDALPQDEVEQMVVLELCNLFRALRSSAMLLTIGDDVHGVSILRGVMEILSKILLAEKFQQEYVLFKNFNLYLQANKFSQEPLPQEMVDYLKDEKEYHKNPEAFLAYGWARNPKGNRILTMKELCRTALNWNADLAVLLQLASEFTHEDYVGIGYDYASIRNGLFNYYYLWYCMLLEDDDFMKGLLFLPSKQIKRLRHLIRHAEETYVGEVPLSEARGESKKKA